ncbi:MAG: hypothetical protein WCO33_02310 [bacterium]
MESSPKDGSETKIIHVTEITDRVVISYPDAFRSRYIEAARKDGEQPGNFEQMRINDAIESIYLDFTSIDTNSRLVIVVPSILARVPNVIEIYQSNLDIFGASDNVSLVTGKYIDGILSTLVLQSEPAIVSSNEHKSESLLDAYKTLLNVISTIDDEELENIRGALENAFPPKFEDNRSEITQVIESLTEFMLEKFSNDSNISYSSEEQRELLENLGWKDQLAFALSLMMSPDEVMKMESNEKILIKILDTVLNILPNLGNSFEDNIFFSQISMEDINKSGFRYTIKSGSFEDEVKLTAKWGETIDNLGSHFVITREAGIINVKCILPDRSQFWVGKIPTKIDQKEIKDIANNPVADFRKVMGIAKCSLDATNIKSAYDS